MSPRSSSLPPLCRHNLLRPFHPFSTLPRNSTTTRTVLYDSPTTAHRNSIIFTPTSSPSCPWTHYLLSNNSPATYKVTNAHFIVNTVMQGHGGQRHSCKLKLCHVSKNKIHLHVSLFSYSVMQRGCFHTTNDPTFGPPLCCHIHTETPQTIHPPPIFRF